MSLTTGTDISGVITGSAGTINNDNNDTFTATADGAGTAGTYTTGDVINGGTGTDVLNLAMTASNDTTNEIATVIGVETINATATSFSDLTYTMTNASLVGTTINLKNAQVGGATGFALAGVGTGATIAADASVTGALAVTTAAATAQTLTLAANSAATQTVALTGSGTADTATLAAAGTVALTVTAVETVNLSGNGAAATYTVTGTAGQTINMTGTQNVTVQAAAATFAGDTVTDSTTAGTTTLKVTSSTATGFDLSKTGADVLEIAAVDAAATYTVKAGQSIKITDATATDTTTFDINDNTTSNVTGAVTIELTTEQKTAKGIVIDATTTNDYINAVTLVNNTVAQDNSVAEAGTPDVTKGLLFVAPEVNLTVNATKAIEFEAGSRAKSINATGSTGSISVIVDNSNDIVSVTGGSANDVLYVGAVPSAAMTFDGGVGTGDKVSLTASTDIATLTLSNVEVIAIDEATTGAVVLDAKASQLSGKTFVISGTATGDTIEINSNNSVDIATMDFSGLVIDTTDVVSLTVDGSKIAGNLGLASVLNITGSSTKDIIDLSTNTGANTVSGGAGDDEITMGSGADTITGGEGADTITGGAGADSIILTETVAAVDTVVFADTAVNNGADTITGFEFGAGKDVLQFKNFVGAAEAETLGATIAGSVDASAKNVVTLTDIQDLTAANFGGTASATVLKTAASQKLVVIADKAADADSVQNIYYVTTDTSNVATVTLVGTINEGTFDTGNIITA